MGRESSIARYAKSAVIRELNYDLWFMVRSYILRLAMGELKAENIKVERVFSYIDPPGILGSVAIVGYDAFNNLIAEGRSLFALISYFDDIYIFSCFMQDGSFLGSFKYMLSVTSDEESGSRVEDLVNNIVKESVINSGYRGKILKLYRDDLGDSFRIKQVEIPEISLDDIFVEDALRMEIDDFVDAVVNLRFSSMKYLFVGEPGTGKTDTIKAVINHCHSRNSNITIFLVNAGDGIDLTTIFEYAQLFKPTLVCIDDIDLIIGTRERTRSFRNLSDVLQILDGFIELDGLYLIATTNDKSLVDYAARRPGRFDLIIEFKFLDPIFYPSIVLRESKDEKFADVFRDERVVEELYGVTGAFIVNLVKYLSRPRFKDLKYDVDFVISAVKQLRVSFELYSLGKIGFLR